MRLLTRITVIFILFPTLFVPESPRPISPIVEAFEIKNCVRPQFPISWAIKKIGWKLVLRCGRLRSSSSDRRITKLVYCVLALYLTL